MANLIFFVKQTYGSTVTGHKRGFPFSFFLIELCKNARVVGVMKENFVSRSIALEQLPLPTAGDGRNRDRFICGLGVEIMIWVMTNRPLWYSCAKIGSFHVAVFCFPSSRIITESSSFLGSH